MTTDPREPAIIHVMRSDPGAEVWVTPSNPAHGKAGQSAEAVAGYVDALTAEVRDLRAAIQRVREACDERVRLHAPLPPSPFVKRVLAALGTVGQPEKDGGT